MKVYFKLYQSDGLTLVYTFPVVQDCNYPASPRRNILIEGTRGKGGILIDGGDSVWDLNITGYLIANSYEELITKIDEMENNVVANTPYILKINKTISTYYEYKVKRIDAIEYPIDEGFRTNYQLYTVHFKVNVW